MTNANRRQFAVARWPLSCAAALSLFASGCVTPWEKSALLSDNLPNIDKIQGPTQRSLRNFFKNKPEEEDDGTGTLKPIKGEPEYLAATELYKQEKYAEAGKAFKKIRKKKIYKHSEIREDALFMEAEAAWQQEHYATAHDAYAVLLKDFPSTRHMNIVSERLFKIGRLWLEFPEVAKLGEIQQANFDNPSKPLPSEEPPKGPKKKPIFLMNLRNKKEPLFDTPGNGVAALSAVWMNDPTGPLADDAMMLVASYHARRGNYVEADRYFQNLRELYPQSPHVQNAFVLGAHVKLMSYQGPNYESRTLSEAELLKKSILNLYPNIPEADRIRKELARIENNRAEIIWTQCEFWFRKGNKRASAIYCHEVITEYPNSPYAKKAEDLLAKMGVEYQSGSVFLTKNEEKKTNILDRIEDPEFYGFKKSKPKSSTIAKNSKPGKSPSRVVDNRKKDAVEDSDSEDDSSSGSASAKKSRRSWLPFGSPPQKLPDDSDSDAKDVKSGSTGKVRL